MRRWNKGRRVERERFNHGAPIAKIDTRPMVFVVMFVALVFLLFAAKTRLHAIEIDLPTIESPPEAAFASVPHITVDVSSESQVFVDGRPIELGEIVESIGATKMANPVVLARFDGAADYNTVAQVLGKLIEAGVASWNICFDGLSEHRYFEKVSSVELSPCAILVSDFLSSPIA